MSYGSKLVLVLSICGAAACGGTPARPGPPAAAGPAAGSPRVAAGPAPGAAPLAGANAGEARPRGAPAPPEGTPAADTAPGPAPPPPGGAPAAAASPGPVPGEPGPPPRLPAGTTVLHIGDSFAGALGIDLNRELRAAGVRAVLKYETATYIPTWASSKELEAHLWKYRPDLVIVTLGANELEIPDPEARAPTIRRLVRRLGGRPCVWVAPPLWPGARPALLETIRANVAPCVYLDSGLLVPDLPRARDGIHPSVEARPRWAAAVAGWLVEHLAPEPGRAFALRP